MKQKNLNILCFMRAKLTSLDSEAVSFYLDLKSSKWLNNFFPPDKNKWVKKAWCPRYSLTDNPLTFRTTHMWPNGIGMSLQLPAWRPCCVSARRRTASRGGKGIGTVRPDSLKRRCWLWHGLEPSRLQTFVRLSLTANSQTSPPTDFPAFALFETPHPPLDPD